MDLSESYKGLRTILGCPKCKGTVLPFITHFEFPTGKITRLKCPLCKHPRFMENTVFKEIFQTVLAPTHLPIHNMTQQIYREKY